jgi:fumarylpyruvate hydrolase
LRLRVNGEQRQAGSLDQLIVSAAELVSLASTIVPLEPGDLILTGTPAGVGRVVEDDVVELSVDGLPDLRVRVVAKAAVDGTYLLKEPAHVH